MSKEFCRAAIDDLIYRINDIAKGNGSLYHMLVLPEGETVKIPMLGGHAIGSSNYEPPGPYEFGSSKVATTLPPKACWPDAVPPMRAVSAEQEYSPYRPLAVEPYRAHLFFGKDNNADRERRALEAYAVSRWADLRRKSKNNYSKNFLVLGDFNLPKVEPSDLIYKVLKKRGL